MSEKRERERGNDKTINTEENRGKGKATKREQRKRKSD